MKQTPREVILHTLTFHGPDRLGCDFPEPYGTDFHVQGMTPSPDNRPYGPDFKHAVDEWGAEWENIGSSSLGEVKRFPLASWDAWEGFAIPDIRDPRRFEGLADAREKAGNKFLMGYGISIYERIHFLRGLENTWTDIYIEPERLGQLLDILTEMNLYAIAKFAAAGYDGIMLGDDWGLQDRLMIAPAKWREIWRPRYARIFACCHEHGVHTFLHSCGYIVDILDDLIDIGLDAIHMDQQENMGLDLLGARFAGRLTFFSPVDIQQTMARGRLDEIRAYCRKMADTLATEKGGFIPRWYSDPKGAGHTREAINAMCEEFLKISNERAVQV